MPPHLQREHDALVSLDGDAGHCEDAGQDGRGLHKGNRLADHHSCRDNKCRDGRIKAGT